MKHDSAFFPPSLIAPLALALLIAGCSNPREDVRVRLCKDMVSIRLGSSQPITWKGSTTDLRGHEDAAIRVGFSSGDKDGHAFCYYRYDAVDDTALTLSDPLSSFSTSPSKMVLNGQTLSRAELAQTVKDAMLRQGGDFVDQVKKVFQ